MKEYLKTSLSVMLLALVSQVSAHYLWIETPESGKLGKAHQVKVFFGEYTHGVTEDPNGENFEGVKNFKLWAIAPSGKKLTIETTAGKEAFVGSFVPEEKGTYTVVLNNDDIEVIDYTEYDFGIFKTHYHATAKVVIGNTVGPTIGTNDTGLVVINGSGKPMKIDEEVTLQVLFKGEPLAGQEVTVFVSDLWTKKLETDAEGKVRLKLPWDTKYTVETTKKEEVPGQYKGVDYEFVWHCATYAIDL